MPDLSIPQIGYTQGISNLGQNGNFASPYGNTDSQNAQGALDNTIYNDSLQDAVYNQINNMNTAFTIRQQIASALHAMSNQAQSFIQQFIGDEIAQAKKSNENAGKAV